MISTNDENNSSKEGEMSSTGASNDPNVDNKHVLVSQQIPSISAVKSDLGDNKPPAVTKSTEDAQVPPPPPAPSQVMVRSGTDSNDSKLTKTKKIPKRNYTNPMVRAVEIVERYRKRGNKIPRLLSSNLADEDRRQEHKDAKRIYDWKQALRGIGKSRCSDEVKAYFDSNMPGWNEDGARSKNAMQKGRPISTLTESTTLTNRGNQVEQIQLQQQREFNDELRSFPYSVPTLSTASRVLHYPPQNHQALHIPQNAIRQHSLPPSLSNQSFQQYHTMDQEDYYSMVPQQYSNMSNMELINEQMYQGHHSRDLGAAVVANKYVHGRYGGASHSYDDMNMQGVKRQKVQDSRGMSEQYYPSNDSFRSVMPGDEQFMIPFGSQGVFPSDNIPRDYSLLPLSGTIGANGGAVGYGGYDSLSFDGSGNYSPSPSVPFQASSSQNFSMDNTSSQNNTMDNVKENSEWI